MAVEFSSVEIGFRFIGAGIGGGEILDLLLLVTV